jgi:predicted nuclease of predicted toxin-antitoxin system
MLRLRADENFDHDLVRAVLRRRSELDLVTVQGVGLSEADDLEILAWAAKEQRVLLTHDVNTITRFAIERIARGEPVAGVFIVHQEGAGFSTIINDLLLLDECSNTSEWYDQIQYLPLR